jgi:hypothetical protein
MKEEKEMCCKESLKKDCCEKPDRLKGQPEECSPEQIRECHCELQEHPCTTKEK